MRGYIAMLAVRDGYRGKGIATELVRKTLNIMIERNADEVFASSLFAVRQTEKFSRLPLKPRSLIPQP